MEARPGGARLYDLINRRAIDAVIFYTLDRVARDEDVVEFPLLKRDLKRAGIELHFCDTGQVDYSNIMGSMIDTFRAAGAADELKKIRERTMRGLHAKAAHGLWVGGGVPPFVTVIQDATIRGGPGTVYLVYGVLKTGATANVLGQDSTKTWFVIVFPQSPDGRGWIWSNLVTLGGDTSNIPIIAAPPTPTFMPTNTFTPSPTVPSPTPTPSYPEPTISANPNPATTGCGVTNTVISWSAPGATSVTIDLLGSQPLSPSGRQSVCVQSERTFTLLATYPDNSQESASVTVSTDFGEP